MKFSTEVDDIEYIIEITDGVETNPRLSFMLDSRQKRLLKHGKMQYRHIKIDASKNNQTLTFMLQGLPLNIDQERCLEELEDFFESNCIYSKVEHFFKLEQRDSKKTLWGES